MQALNYCTTAAAARVIYEINNCKCYNIAWFLMHILHPYVRILVNMLYTYIYTNQQKARSHVYTGQCYTEEDSSMVHINR